ncbi:hypothetical protein B0H63DRAFT_555863 [Podospora didyma]|uniref:SAM and PH domain-containing protein n=1 Tax=Podospora didyma TaxID=330526 RepID=A0AAE0P7C8_9PEZI|nr:hypothetical protein B0H63DRAFT_555863 [Podospora didyma]
MGASTTAFSGQSGPQTALYLTVVGGTLAAKCIGSPPRPETDSTHSTPAMHQCGQRPPLPNQPSPFLCRRWASASAAVLLGEHIHFPTREHPHIEMCEKSRGCESFFAVPATALKRTNSVHTEFMETDWEEDAYSEIEDLEGVDDGEISPRMSVGSSGQPSITTLSSYDEVQTPRSGRYRAGGFPFERDAKQVEGPRGPHLFRSSMSSSQSAEFQHALSLSPLTPKKPQQADHQLHHSVHLTTLPKKRRDTGPFRYTDEELDTSTLANWTPEMVAQWMLNANVELAATERFVENDINGAILITLKFEDLKELGISSFGVRTRVWEEIHSMRNIKQPEPTPETPIDDEPDREVKRELRRQDSSINKPKRRPSKTLRPKINDIISPLESVSIVGIEQMMPKPHRCSKGENCPKWKRNQRMIEAFKKDHPFVNVEEGVIMVAGDPGNPETAEALRSDEFFRPVSDAIPSVVASSDVMGPGNLPPLQYLQEAALRSIQSRDPQDNVRQFLDFQHQTPSASTEVPPTPPFEVFPHIPQDCQTAQHTQPAQQTHHVQQAQQSQHAQYAQFTQQAQQAQPTQGPQARLRSLPKLAIPYQPPAPIGRETLPAQPRSAHPLSAHPLSARPGSTQPIPSFREMSPSSSEDATPTAIYRFGTPFSEMDVPVTMTTIPPVSRDFSQSVPPDMNYRHNPAPPRSMSRATIRRPSFPVLPALDENSIVTPITYKPSRSFSVRAAAAAQRPLQAPPRVQYPWSQTDRTIFERAIPPMPGSAAANGMAGLNYGGRLSPLSSAPKIDMTGGAAISYQGLMKKRKTKMLRHEWHEHYFTLRGTRLTMHKDAATAPSKTLEYIDIDDYAIACSSMASSKLNAAFKAMHIRRGSDGTSKDDVSAFSFQLIPQDAKGGVRLRKRESALPSILGGGSNANASAANNAAGPDGAANGTGKTHHFAVKSRDDRIDWMRELMLAKALKQKGEGFEYLATGG